MREVIRNCCWLLLSAAYVGFPFSDVSADDNSVRVWHDRSGFFTLDAEIIGVDRDQAGPRLKLRKDDGTIVGIPYSIFSEADQKFAVDWHKTQQTKPTTAAPPKLPVVGDRVKNHWGSTWYSGTIVEVDADRFKFRYDGYSASWDEWKTAANLRWEDDSPVVPSEPPDANKADTVASSTVKPERPKGVTPNPAGNTDTAGDTDTPMAKAEPSADKPAATSVSKTPGPGRVKLPVVGDRTKMEWGGKWWPGVIMEVDGKRFRFNYDGWDSSPDEWRTADQLRWEDDTAVIPGGPADVASSGGASPTPAKSAVTDTAAPKSTMDLSRFTLSIETSSPFPPGLSPQQTLDYLKKETMAGRLQVFWDWIPDEMRNYATSQEQRDNLALLDQVRPAGLGADHFLSELVTVLRTKKAFVLQNPIVALLLETPGNIAAFTDVYAPVTALLDESTQLLGNIDTELRGTEFETAFRGRCDRIGKQIATLIESAPPDQVQAFWDRIYVTPTEDGGTLTMAYPGGQNKTFELVRINGRWMPRTVAESLLAYPELQRAKAMEIKALSKARIDGRYQGASMAQGYKDASYMSLAEKLRAAAQSKSQSEFDASIQQVLVALQAGGWLGR